MMADWPHSPCPDDPDDELPKCDYGCGNRATVRTKEAGFCTACAGDEIDRLSADAASTFSEVLRYPQVRALLDAARHVHHDCRNRAALSRDGKTVPIGASAWRKLNFALADIDKGVGDG